MLDTRQWPGSFTHYVKRLPAVTENFLSRPRHFFRSYSAGELGRMMIYQGTREVPAPVRRGRR
jgi:hypothetical protein